MKMFKKYFKYFKKMYYNNIYYIIIIIYYIIMNNIIYYLKCKNKLIYRKLIGSYFDKDSVIFHMKTFRHFSFSNAFNHLIFNNIIKFALSVGQNKQQ